MNGPKRHHIIPRLHLQYFTGVAPLGQLWTYDKTTGQQWSAAPENTAVEGYFYAGERTDGSADNSIEAVIAQVEDLAMPGYQLLLTGCYPSDPRTRAGFAHFVALLYARTRVMRQMVADVYGRFMQIHLYVVGRDKRAFDQSMREYEEYLGRRITDEEREDYREALLNPSQFEFVIPKELTFSVLGVADRLMPIFLKMRWWVQRADGAHFITSDNPVVREVDPSTAHPIYGDMGFFNPTQEVTLPLSSTHLLLMTLRDEPYRDTLPAELVDLANQARAAHADRFLYAAHSDDRTAALAAAFRHSRAAVKTDGLGPKQFGKIHVHSGRRKPRSPSQ